MSDDVWREEPKVKRWLERIGRSGGEVRSMSCEWQVTRKDNELLFGAFRTDTVDRTGTPLPPVVVIRGDAVVVVPQVRNRDTGETRFLAIRQPRIGNGDTNLEFPAGMLDRDIDDPRGVAARELHEETGVPVEDAALFALHDKPLHTSVGLLDESIFFYGCMLDVDNTEYADLRSRQAGEPSEREHIVTALCTADEIRSEACSMQVLLGLALFERKLR